MRLVLCYPVEPKHLAQISAVVPHWEVVNAGQERVAQEILHADFYCGHAKVPVPWDEVVKKGRLKWIQSSAAGVDHCLHPAIVESGIPVTSASGVLADQVTEHSIALATALSRSLPVFFRAQQKKEYIRRPTRDLTHSTCGIVGLGGVGRRLSKALSVFKTRIVATDYYPVHKPAWVEALWAPDQLPQLLAQSDFVFLCAPLNSLTRGMIHQGMLACMKPSAYLVNVARGPLVVEADLIETLQAGKIAGAAMDVAEVEPLAETSPLWEMPNVIITPHVGGQSFRRIDDMTDFFCDNLRRHLAGEPLRNVVDKRLGFPRPETGG